MEHYKKIVLDEFNVYFQENWEEGRNWEEFIDEAACTLYNSYHNTFVEDNYYHIVFFLKIIKEHSDWIGEFKDYDDPQKIYNLGMLFLAVDTLNEIDEEEYKKRELSCVLIF